MPSRPDKHARSTLPIPDRPIPGLTTYDAKDPETRYPPIEPLLPPEVEFAYDGGGLAMGGKVTLFHDGSVVGEGRVEMTQPMVFSADETTDIGHEVGTAVSSDYTAATSRFNGKIQWVQIDLGDDDHDHQIDDEDRMRIALSRQ